MTLSSLSIYVVFVDPHQGNSEVIVTPSVLRRKQITKSCHQHHVYVIMYVMECVDNIFVT